MAASVRDDDDVQRLISLLDACHQVLAHLGDRQDRIARAVGLTCSELESRLQELGVSYMETEGVVAEVSETRYG